VGGDNFSGTRVKGEGQAVVLCYVQGLYFLATGVWPLVSIDTFQMVTGPKTDLWLVRTVGALIVAVALTLLTAAWRRRQVLEVGLLAAVSAAVLTAVDVVYVSLGVIHPVYLLDAALEVLLLAGWGFVLWQERAA